MFTTAGVAWRAMALKSGPGQRRDRGRGRRPRARHARVSGSTRGPRRRPASSPTARPRAAATATRRPGVTPASRGRPRQVLGGRTLGSSRRRRPSLNCAVTRSGSTSSVSWNDAAEGTVAALHAVEALRPGLLQGAPLAAEHQLVAVHVHLEVVLLQAGEVHLDHEGLGRLVDVRQGRPARRGQRGGRVPHRGQAVLEQAVHPLLEIQQIPQGIPAADRHLPRLLYQTAS